MPIEQQTKLHIEKLFNNLVDEASVVVKDITKVHLEVRRENGESFRVYLSENTVEDFNDAILNYQNRPYFYTIENLLKYDICSKLIAKKLYPKIYVSNEMIYERGDWYGANLANTFQAIFDEKMTKVIADGMKTLLKSLDQILQIDITLSLDTISQFRKEAGNIYEHYGRNQNFNENHASIDSLQYLKTAALCKIIELEKQKEQSSLTVLKNAIDEEIYFIARELHGPLFIHIQIPEIMISVKELLMLRDEQAQKEKHTDTIVKKKKNWGNSGVEHYDIAFSLAHEQHEYVDVVFEELIKLLPDTKIFYYRDEEQEVKMWGKNMFEHLQSIYRDCSGIVIIFISKEYIEKKWARHEWRSVQEAILDRKSEYLLPARFDDSTLPGLPITINYVDITSKEPQKFAKMIADKVGIKK